MARHYKALRLNFTMSIGRISSAGEKSLTSGGVDFYSQRSTHSCSARVGDFTNFLVCCPECATLHPTNTCRNSDTEGYHCDKGLYSPIEPSTSRYWDLAYGGYILCILWAEECMHLGNIASCGVTRQSTPLWHHTRTASDFGPVTASVISSWQQSMVLI